jgi:hypothetical protein
MAMNDRNVFSRGQQVSVFDEFSRRWSHGVVLAAHGDFVHIETSRHIHCVGSDLVRQLYLVEAHP